MCVASSSYIHDGLLGCGGGLMPKPSACASHVHQAAGDLQGGIRREGPRICSLLPHPEAQIQCQVQEEVG